MNHAILFFLFVVSGFCGLLYQVVWLRLAFAAFGIVTPVLSVVLSVFMVGLALGSWAGGKLANRALTARWSPLWLYAAIEAGIGLGAFAVPASFHLGQRFLFGLGGMESARYLLASGVLIGLSILPWCFLMGATFPTAMAFVKRQTPGETHSFSHLYLANVIGAMAGALLTAVVLIECLGFSHTLWVAAALNVSIALVSSWLAARDRSVACIQPATSVRISEEKPDPSLLFVLFLTGFASMAMEVIWTRAFTPVLKTNIYAFAMILVTYLLATWIGSLLYRKHLSRKKAVAHGTLLSGIAFAACLPIALNDPRLHLQGVGALLSIFPLCALLGYLTPMLVDIYSTGQPKRAGRAYATNTAGCVLGPLFSGYLLLPLLGVKGSLVVLALPFFAWALLSLPRNRPGRSIAAALACLGILLVSVGPARSYEEQALASKAEVRRDHTATVISYQDAGGNKQMSVNGIGITILTSVTKLMAHIPLAFLQSAPNKALVICFGMGTTFRSLMSWGIDTWAAELVPSVRDAFGYYFADGPGLLASPRAHLVIDDGRRFLRRTQEMFDVITLDPPPPIEAAGSSLLYSTGFYHDAVAHLKPGGILQQWFPGGENKILQAIAQSLTTVFPYIRVFRSIEFGGHHFLASQRPIPVRDASQLLAHLPPAAQRDLMEWYPGQQPLSVLQKVLSKEVPLADLLQKPSWQITDDRPLNEYYLLRRLAERYAVPLQ